MLLNQKIPFKYLFQQVKYDILRILIISIIFFLIKKFFIDEYLILPIALPALLGTSISLLLAFKLNQSYDRWWEARKIWSGIVNDSRSLILEIKGFISDKALKENETQLLIRQIAFRQIGWCYCLRQALRDQNPLENLEEFLSQEELNELRKQNNKPLYLLMLHMNDLKKLHQINLVNDFQQIKIQDTITRLCASMGSSERINTTVFPATYTKFIRFFIYLFLASLSMVLVETAGIWEIPILIVIAIPFFLLETSAALMQDPFRNRPTDTPMTYIVRNIEINIKQLLHEKDIPQPEKPDSFYLL
jgi:putative membrane protein